MLRTEHRARRGLQTTDNGTTEKQKRLNRRFTPIIADDQFLMAKRIEHSARRRERKTAGIGQQQQNHGVRSRIVAIRRTDQRSIVPIAISFQQSAVNRE